MAELKTKRQYEERFLDNYDRSQLRRDVQKVKPNALTGMRKRYASWALGASLALGGIGIPMRVIQQSQNPQEPSQSMSVDETIAGDLRAASNIAQQVAGGVLSGVENVATAPLKAMVEAPAQLAVISENTKEHFFKTQVPFGSIIYHEAKKNDLKPELVAAVVQAESRFKPNARSGVGAVGLMQLMPRTGKWMGARNLSNPAQNIQAGTKYLKYLNERFDGNETKVIAAYNAGEGNVRRFGGVPPFRETRNYVNKVRNYEADFREQVESHVADASVAEASR